ncbi:MAG: hypothetical protein HOE90_24990 [Bacteriovoracaceae bacterium]|jgi:predicted hydrocarbon binding protein|nr:hypothetical protein [Bacteriovoracaceae bacterium]
MKGLIFNQFEKFVNEKFESDYFEKILIDCKFNPADPFVGPGTYPFASLVKMLEFVVNDRSVELDDVLRDFGQHIFPKLYEVSRSFEVEFTDCKSFLHSVEEIIHVEVKKLYEGSELPKFLFKENCGGDLTITYISEKGLCSFMEGLLQASFKHFSQEVEISQIKCTSKGDENCQFLLKTK